VHLLQARELRLRADIDPQCARRLIHPPQRLWLLPPPVLADEGARQPLMPHFLSLRLACQCYTHLSHLRVRVEISV
jgi:hypothetical protein